MTGKARYRQVFIPLSGRYGAHATRTVLPRGLNIIDVPIPAQAAEDVFSDGWDQHVEDIKDDMDEETAKTTTETDVIDSTASSGFGTAEMNRQIAAQEEPVADDDEQGP